MSITPEFSDEYYAYLLRINSANNNDINQDYMDLLIQCKKHQLINHTGVDSGMTALHRAVLAENINKIYLLKLAGADPELRSNPPRNQTALELAYLIKDKAKRDDVIKLLNEKLDPCDKHFLCLCRAPQLRLTLTNSRIHACDVS